MGSEMLPESGRLQGVYRLYSEWEAIMRTATYGLAVLLILSGLAVGQGSAAKKASKKAAPVVVDTDFANVVQKLEAEWVQAFNSGDAKKVADMYAPDAVLMRWDGSVHGHDSILAEMERSAAGSAGNYVVHSLHAERSGDIGYDTGAYNVTLRGRVVEGNYVVVLRKIGNDWKIVAHASVPNPAAP
jgi:ketosteroid isomerase-like protein